jgi:ribulose-phosphate 3-epimerase
VEDLRKLIDNKGYDATIQVDGRVSLDTIPMLVKAGADNLVLGSTSLFMKDDTLEENKKRLDAAVKEGL